MAKRETTYTEVMAEAMLTAAQDLPFNTRRNGYDWSMATKEQLSAVDWDSIELPPPAGAIYPVIDEQRLKFATQLTLAAFVDGRRLVEMCDIVARERFPTQQQQNAGLKASRVALLKVAELHEEDKVAVFEHFDRANDPESQVMFGALNGSHLIEANYTDDHDLRFSWQPSVQEWIKEHRIPGVVGCPAMRHVIDTGAGKELLIHTFWDKLVDITYPVDSTN